MSMATVSSKGQITIPQDIRDFLKVGPGDRVFISVEGEHAVITGVPKVDSLKVAEALREGWGKKIAIPLKEAEKILSSHAAERDQRSRRRR